MFTVLPVFPMMAESAFAAYARPSQKGPMALVEAVQALSMFSLVLQADFGVEQARPILDTIGKRFAEILQRIRNQEGDGQTEAIVDSVADLTVWALRETVQRRFPPDSNAARFIASIIDTSLDMMTSTRGDVC